uniref:Cell division cycle associated 4 n=1 Tax=Otolemur garnettii TaxID=30611 RepID=H0XQM2_OTOGA
SWWPVSRHGAGRTVLWKSAGRPFLQPAVAVAPRHIPGEAAVLPHAGGTQPLLLSPHNILCCGAPEQVGVRPVPDVGEGHVLNPASELSAVPLAQVPRNLQDSVWMDSSQENRGSFQKSLDRIFETLETRSPGSTEELFSDLDSSHCDLDMVLTGMVSSAKPGPCDGLQSLAPAAISPPPSTCKSDLGKLDHVVEILVET